MCSMERGTKQVTILLCSIVPNDLNLGSFWIYFTSSFGVLLYDCLVPSG